MGCAVSDLSDFPIELNTLVALLIVASSPAPADHPARVPSRDRRNPPSDHSDMSDPEPLNEIATVESSAGAVRLSLDMWTNVQPIRAKLDMKSASVTFA